jgi:phosphocarrier protein HPr
VKEGSGFSFQGSVQSDLLNPEPWPLKTMMATASRDIVVSNKLGLHARPAMQFVDLANQFSSTIKVIKGGEEPGEADGKSVMQMIILAATEGTPMRIEADGDDAEQAAAKLAELFETKFGEED